MLICQIVFFVWRQRLGKTRETFLFKKKKQFKFPSVKVPSSVNAASALILGENKQLKAENDDLKDENDDLESDIDDLEEKIEYTDDALSS